MMQIKGRVLLAVVSLVFAASALALVRHSRRERPRTDFSMTKGLTPAHVTYTGGFWKDADICRWYVVQGDFREVGAALAKEAPHFAVSPPPSLVKDHLILSAGTHILNVIKGDKVVLGDFHEVLLERPDAKVDLRKPWCVVAVGEPAGKEYLPPGLLHTIWKANQAQIRLGTGGAQGK